MHLFRKSAICIIFVTLSLGCKPRTDASLANADANAPYGIFLGDSFSLNPANSQSFYDDYAQSFIFEPLMEKNSSGYTPVLADVQVTCTPTDATSLVILPQKSYRSWPDHRPINTKADKDAIASDHYQIAITNVDIAFSSILLTHDGALKAVQDDKHMNLKRDYAKLRASLRQIGANNRGRLSKPKSFALIGYNQLSIAWEKPDDCETFADAVKTMPIVPEHVFNTQSDGIPFIAEFGTSMCPDCGTATDRLLQRSTQKLEEKAQKQAQEGPTPAKKQEPVKIEVGKLWVSNDGKSFNVEGFHNHMVKVGENGTSGSGPYEVISEVVDRKLFGLLSMPFYQGQKDLNIANYTVGRYRNSQLRIKHKSYCNPILSESLCDYPDKFKVILYGGANFLAPPKSGMEFGDGSADEYDLAIDRLPQKKLTEAVDLNAATSRVRVYPSNELMALAFNITKFPNVHLRQAIAFAINRIAIDQIRLEEYRKNRINGYSYSGSSPEPAETTQKYRFFSIYDATLAETELKQSSAQRNTLSMSIAYNAHSIRDGQTAERIKSDLMKLGMKIKLQPFTDENYVRALSARDDLAKFDALLVRIPDKVLRSPYLLTTIFGLDKALIPEGVDGFTANLGIIANQRPLIPLYNEDLFLSISERAYKACQTDPSNGGFPAFLKERFFCSVFLGR